MGTPAIFLDRDGVINENRPDHVKSWAEFRFLPGALEALRALRDFGLPIVVITNQAVIGRRLATRQTIEGIHRRMVRQIRVAGGEVTRVLYCPHDPAVGCACRKPAPGLLLAAAVPFEIDLTRSVVIGDALTDLQAAERCGSRTVLVLTGRGRDTLRDLAAGATPQPQAIASDLLAAVPLLRSLLQLAPTTDRALAPPPAVPLHLLAGTPTSLAD